MPDAKPSRSYPMFIDIESVPRYQYWDQVPHELEVLFTKKFEREIIEQFNEHTPMADAHAQVWKEKAALFAEFGKIVCVSIGLLSEENGVTKLRVKAIAPFGKKTTEGQDYNEHVLLTEAAAALSKARNGIAGHNVREFDIPFLSRRMMIKGIAIPDSIATMGKKPWDLNFIDTKEIWKCGAYQHSVSLATLAHLFELPSPKTGMDGSMVADVYYSKPEKDVLPFVHEEAVMTRIADYCNGDVATTANVWLKMMRLPIVAPQNVEIVKEAPKLV